MSRIITVASAKGGVGKSTIALNLAAALCAHGHDAIVVDANLSSPTLAINLGKPLITPTIHHVLTGKTALTHAIHRHPKSNLKILPGSITLNHALDAPVDELHNITTTLRAHFPYVIIDSAPGVRDETQAGIAIADEVIVIATPDQIGTLDGIKTVELAKKLGKPATAVLNMVRDETPAELANTASLLRASVLKHIPHDENIRRSARAKQPVTSHAPDSPAGRALHELAKRIITGK